MEPCDKSPSDQIRIIKAERGLSDTVMLIQAVTRSLIAFAIVSIGGIALLRGAQIPHEAQEIGLLVLGAYFGTEAFFKFLSRSKNSS